MMTMIYPGHSVRDSHGHQQRISAGAHRWLEKDNANQTVGDERHCDEERRHDAVYGDRLAAAVQRKRLHTVE